LSQFLLQNEGKLSSELSDRKGFLCYQSHDFFQLMALFLSIQQVEELI